MIPLAGMIGSKVMRGVAARVLGWSVKWNGRQVEARVRSHMTTIIRTAALQMVADIKSRMTHTIRRSVYTRDSSIPGFPPAVQEGTLRDAIAADLSEVATRQIAYVGVTGDAPHGLYMELGTAPHTIVPRVASVLSWDAGIAKGPNPKTGRIQHQRAFARRVNHPGTAPRPFLRPAFDRIREPLMELIRGAGGDFR